MKTLHQLDMERRELKINSLVDLYDLNRPEFQRYQIEILQLVEKLKAGKIWLEDFGLGTDLKYPVTCRMWEYIMIYLNTYTLPTSRILDIGSGNSIMPIWLATKGVKEVIACDLNPEYLKAYDKAAEMLGLNNLKTLVADASSLPQFPDQYFDSISSVCVIEHLPLEKQAQALKEWARLTKYRLGLTFDYGDGADNPFHNASEVDERLIKVLKETGMQMFGNLGYNYEPLIPYSSLDYTFGSLFFERPRACVSAETKYGWDGMKIDKNITLSSYIVAKNEIAFFDLAVKSIIDDVDELVIVDTGSTDGTWEIAKEWQKLIPSKVKIFKFNLIGFDLSEARNFAMSQCTKDWILVVDGDEVWSKSELIKVKKLISNTSEVAFRPLSVRPLVSFKKCEAGIWMERIFKNGVDIRYKGVWPGDLSYHKDIPIYLYYTWPDIHYFHLASMKPEKERLDKWETYHKLTNPEYTLEHCRNLAKTVMHVNGQNPNAIECPFPIPEVLRDRLNSRGEITRYGK